MRRGVAAAVSVLLAAAALGVSVASGASGAPGHSGTSRRPPNIVFVLLDDARPDEIEQVAALRPDGGFAWVRDHATRTRLWYGDNLCCPSRTTILTGRTQFNTGVLSNTRFPELGRATLPAWLRAVGYCTGFTGKYLNKYTQHDPRPPGWTYWEPMVGRFKDEYGYGVVQRDGSVRLPHRFVTDEIGRVSRAQLRDCLAERQPAFVALWPVAPHDQSDPAPEYADVAVPPVPRDPSFGEADVTDKPAWLQSKYPTSAQVRFDELRAHRVRTLFSVDDAIVRLRDQLSARGQVRRTVFVLTTDNGFLLGEHRIVGRKELAYEAAQGLLWVAGPGWSSGVDVDAFAHNTDLAATVLEVAGDSGSDQRTDGVPLQRTVAAPTLGHDRFLPLYVPAEGQQQWARPTGEGVRTWRYKYVHYADGSEELYDLVVDPSELTNVAGDPAYATIRAELVSLAQQAKECRGDTCRRPAPADLRR